jgi:SAM-dependent methyltransferase
MAQPNELTPERILQMVWGHAPAFVIEAAVRNRVFDTLAAGPKSVPQIASATGASERGLRAVCDALVGLQLLERRGESFALTPESEKFLVSERPGSFAGFFEHITSQVVPHWLHVADAVRTGRPSAAVNVEGTGAKFFAEFVESLFPLSYMSARRVAEDLRLAQSAADVSVLDVAAGSGVWGIALAQSSPKVRVTAVDWEGVLPVTRRLAQRNGVADRFRFVAGDLATADFGKGHQIATLGHILHSEGEAKSRRLLQRVHDALASGGTIVIAEFVVDDDRRGPPIPLFFAVNMLVLTESGDAFTFAEMSRWLEQTGFANVRRLEAPAPSPLILATKP